jgi:ATP-dependent Clp protease ATP-binding subunit ClpA
VEATAEALLKNARAVIKIDCAEFQHSHEIAKLIGSPPGYLGHRETHPLLSQEVLDQHHTVTMKLSLVLFDEIEKASDALWNLLLGILDKGTLTLGDNRKVDFSRSIIFMTSNLGAAEMTALVSPVLGFNACDSRSSRHGEIDRTLSRKIERSGLCAVRRKFTPEFINRLDKIITFKPLGPEQLAQILDIELEMIRQRIFDASIIRSFAYHATQSAKTFLLQQGTDMKYGARHLKRAIERLLVQPLSNLIATAQIRGGDYIRIDLSASGNALTFVKEAEGLPSRAMPEHVEQPIIYPALALANRASADRTRRNGTKPTTL